LSDRLFERNFLFMVAGQAMLMFGTAILKFTLSLYILDITGSAAIFGTIMALTVIPTIFLSPFGGILADRFNKRNMMVILAGSYAVIAL
jgi:hypothetical protein